MVCFICKFSLLIPLQFRKRSYKAQVQQTAVYNHRSRERGLKDMDKFLKAFPILHAVRAELRLLKKGQPVRDQLPTVEKLSALRRKLFER